MEPSIANNFLSTTGWIGFAALGILGLLVLVGLFDKTRRGRDKDIVKQGNNSEDRLIRLKDEIIKTFEVKDKEKEQQIEELQNIQKEHQDKITKLTAENDFMVKIFQGRDTETVNFQRNVLVAIQGQNDNIKSLTAVLERHFGAIEKSTKANG